MLHGSRTNDISAIEQRVNRRRDAIHGVRSDGMIASGRHVWRPYGAGISPWHTYIVHAFTLNLCGEGRQIQHRVPQSLPNRAMS